MSTTSSENNGSHQLIPDVNALQKEVNSALSALPTTAEKISELEIIVSSLTDIDETNFETDTTKIAHIWYSIRQYNLAKHNLQNNIQFRKNKIQALLKDNPALSEISRILELSPADIQNAQINIEVSQDIVNTITSLLNTEAQSADIINEAYQKFTETLLNDSSAQTAWARTKITQIQSNAQLTEAEKQQKIKEVAKEVLNQAEAAKLVSECKDLATIISSNGATIPQNATFDSSIIAFAKQMNDNAAVYVAAQERFKQFAQNARENHMMKELLQEAADSNNPFMYDFAIALVASTAEGQEYSPTALRRLYDEIQKLSPEKTPHHFTFAERKDLIDWALENTANEAEKTFLTRLRDEYNYDLSAYLKKQAPAGQTPLSDDIAGRWTAMMQDIALSNASVKFFTTIQSRRGDNPHRNEPIQQPDASVDNQAPSTTNETENQSPPSNDNGGTQPEPVNPSSMPSQPDTSVSPNVTPQPSSEEETDTNTETGTNQSSDSTDEEITPPVSTPTPQTDENQTSSTTVQSNPARSTPTPASTQQPSTVSPAREVSQPKTTMRGNSGSAGNGISMPHTTVSEPVAQPQAIKPQQTRSQQVMPPQEAPYSPNQADKERIAMAAAQAEAEKKEEGNWFTRNWSTILMALAIIATMGIAYFFIRKNKKDADKSKDEANALKTQVSELQDKINDLNQNNASNSASNSTNNTNTSNNTSATLAQNATALKNTEMKSSALSANNKANSIG